MHTDTDNRTATWTENTLLAVHLARQKQPVAGRLLLARVLGDGQSAAVSAATALTVYLADWLQRHVTAPPGGAWELKLEREFDGDDPDLWANRVLTAHLNGDTAMMAAHYATTSEEQWAPRVRALFALAVFYLPRWEEKAHAAAGR